MATEETVTEIAKVKYSRKSKKMTRNSNNDPEFYVVQFLEMPFEGIDDYVCLPDIWLMSNKVRKEAVIVTYPTNEDPMVTRERVKRKERYNNEWKYYMAAIKYESNTYSDAEQWIAAIDDCGPLVINESETTDTQKIITLNEKSQSSNENHSLKFNNYSWKPKPRPSIKRAVPSEPKKQLVGKKLKLDDDAQSSRVIVTDANTESKREQLIIIQDNQSIECTQEEKAPATSTIDERREHTEQNKQALSLPVIDVNELPKAMDQSIDEENYSQSIKMPDRNKSNSESHLFSNTTDSRCITKKFLQLMTAEEPSNSTEQTTQANQYNNQEHIIVSRNLSSNSQPQIENFQSLANVHNVEIRNHKDSNNLKSTPLLSSLELLASTQRPTEKEICPMNIKENVVAQKPSNLMDQTASLSARSVEEKQSVVSKNHSQDSGSGNSKVQIGPLRSVTGNFEETQQHVPKINAQPHNMTFVDPNNGFRSASNTYTQENLRSHQNPYQPTNPNSFEHDLLRESKESNTGHNREIGRIRTPFIGQNSTNPSNQSHPYQQDKNGITKKTMPPMSTKVTNPELLHLLLTTHNKCLQNEHQLQANQSKRALVNENHLNVISSLRQIDKSMEEETLSSYHRVNLVSNAVTDHEANMSTDGAPMETRNNFFGNEITSSSRCLDRPIASQNSMFSNQQTDAKVILKRKMLEKFKNAFTQMYSTLQYTREMYQTLQSLIYDSAELYQQVKDAVEEYNKAGNACHASNLTPEVPQFPLERNIQVPARANSRNDNQYSNNVANKAAKKQTQ